MPSLWLVASLSVCRHCPVCAMKQHQPVEAGDKVPGLGHHPFYPAESTASLTGSLGVILAIPASWQSVQILLAQAQSVWTPVPEAGRSIFDSFGSLTSTGLLYGKELTRPYTAWFLGASLWSHLYPVSSGLSAAGPTVVHTLLCRLPPIFLGTSHL